MPVTPPPSLAMKQDKKPLKIAFAIEDDADAQRIRELAKKKGGLALAAMCRMALMEYVERES
jgi:hypothetical protein